MLSEYQKQDLRLVTHRSIIMRSKIFDIAIALNILAFYMFIFTIIFAEYFGGLFQSFIVGNVIFGTCFLVVGLYIIMDKD